MHKQLLAGIIGLVILSAVITLFQIWAPLLDWAIYIKLMVTLGILILLLAFLLVVKSDLGEHKKLKDDNYLD